MDIVLGVSMTPTTVRMVLIEGEKADGVTVANDFFETNAMAGAATSSACEQVSSAVLRARKGALAVGHQLIAVGVTWNEHVCDVAVLRDSLAARGIDDVTLVSELDAAGALARELGATLAHDTTALLFITRDTATLSVVRTADGSIGRLLSRSLRGTDEVAELTAMVADLDGPQNLFVVGSGVDIGPVRAHLESCVRLPVSAPEDPDFALARGVALVAATAPRAAETTAGIAYSKDPDAESVMLEFASATGPLALAELATQRAPVGPHVAVVPDTDVDSAEAPQSRWRILPVGSLVAATLVFAAVAVVMTVAANVRPMADQRPSPIEQAVPSGISALAPVTQEQAVNVSPSPPVVESPPVAAQPIPAQAPPVAAVSNPVIVPPPAPRAVAVKASPVKNRAAAAVPVAAPDVPIASAPEPLAAVAPVAVPSPVTVPPLANPALTLPADPPPMAPRFGLPQLNLGRIFAAPTQAPSGLSPMFSPSLGNPTQQPVQQYPPQGPILRQLLPILQWPRQQTPQFQAPQAQYPEVPQGTQSSPWPDNSLQPQIPVRSQLQQPQAQYPEVPQGIQDSRWPVSSQLQQPQAQYPEGPQGTQNSPWPDNSLQPQIPVRSQLQQPQAQYPETPQGPQDSRWPYNPLLPQASPWMH